LVFKPRQFGGLEAGINFYKVRQSNAIVNLSAQAIITDEAIFSDLVQRAAPTAEDLANHRPGRLVRIRTIPTNYGFIKTRGVDFYLRAKAELSGVTLTPFLNVTYIDSFKTQLAPRTKAREVAGLARSSPGTILKWKGNAGVNLTAGPFSGGLVARYIDSFTDIGVASAVGPKVASQVLFDLNASYLIKLGRSPRPDDGMRLSLNVINLFDRAPEFANNGFTLGYDPSVHDIRGRTAYLELGYRF
jgi:outer membrane receptor protein involved in Fe transport